MRGITIGEATIDPAWLVTLGRTEIRTSNGTSVLPEREAFALAYLCAQPGQRATRQTLIGFLWPGIDERRSRHSLSQLLYGLRRRSPGVLVVDGESIFVSNLKWDVAELYALIDEGNHSGAVNLYRGAFLAVHDSTDRLADWRDEIDAKVSAVVADALAQEVLTCDSITLSELSSLAEQLADRHPHLVFAQSAAIQAAVRAGNITHARHLHQQYSNAEEGELPSFDHFIRHIRGNESPRTAMFVGRTGELRKLDSIWRAAQGGMGQVAILLGEAGIGKTALAEHFLRKVAVSGGKLWMVSCCAATQRLPYSAARDLYRDNIASIDTDARRLVEDAFASLELFGASAPDEARHRLTEAFTSAAAATAEMTPLVVFVDDAQWADQYTALLISYWAHRLKETPVFILLTVRTQEPEQYPEWIAADLARVTRIELHHLSIDSANELVRSFERVNGVTFDPMKRDGLLWLSGGRPFLLLEALTASLHEEADSKTLPSKVLTPTAESVLKRRYRNLSEEANTVAEFLAIWGKPLLPAMAASAVSLSENEAADAVDTLLSRGIVNITGRQISFVHELMRETALRLLPPGRRVLLHRKAAELAARSGEPTGFVAEQYAAAGDNENAVENALKAAYSAYESRSYADYLYYLRLAHAHGDTDTRQKTAGDLAVHFVSVGQIDEVREIYDSLLSAHPCRPLLSVALELDSLSQGVTAVDQIVRASQLIRLTETQEPLGVVRILGSLFDVALDASSPGFMKELLLVFERIASTSSSTDVRRQLAAYEAVSHVRRTGLEYARQRAQHVVMQLSESDRPSTRALCKYTLGTLYLLEGRVADAIEEFDRALTDAEVGGDIKRQHAIYINRGVALVESGEIPLGRESLAKALASSHLHVRIRSYANLAIAHYEGGRNDLAADAAATVITMNHTYQSNELARQANAILGLVAIDHSDAEGITIARQFCHAAPTIDNVYEDTSYFTVLRARLELMNSNIDNAFSLLAREASKLEKFNKLAALRTRGALAEILCDTDVERAYGIAKAVYNEALALNAKQIQKRVAPLLAMPS